MDCVEATLPNPSKPSLFTFESDDGDRRDIYRQRTIKRGLIVFRDGYCAVPCQILDISADGAQLSVGDSLLFPKEFALHMEGAAPRNCRRMWRTPTKIGVRYI